MNKIYAICIPRKNQSPYCIEMPLEEIDKIFNTYKKEEILKIIHDYDSVMTETDPENLTIRTFLNGNWVNDHDVQIETNSVLLNYSFPEVYEKISKKESLNKDLYHHFQKYLNRYYVSDLFKDAIRNQTFVEDWDHFSYEEKRLIRLYVASRIDLENYISMDKKENRVTEKIETLVIPEEKNLALLRKKDEINKKEAA